MTKLLSLLIVLILLVSCGTIGGRKNIVPFDSNPRGLFVYDERGKLLGETPFFFDISPRHKQYFIFKVPDNEGDWSSKELYKCPVDWGQSVVPGVVPVLFGIGGIIIGGLSLTVDAISGHLFVCQEPLFVGRDLLPKTTVKERMVLVLPLFDKDVKVSEKVRKHWLDNQFKAAKSDDRIIDLERSHKLMEFRGISNASVPTFQDIKKRNLNTVASELNATHALYLKRGKGAERNTITPVLYDLFTGQEENTDYLDSFHIPPDALVKHSYLDTLIGIINLVPNSMTFTYVTNPNVYFDSPEHGVTKNSSRKTDEHPEALPVIISYLGVSNILHPQFYDPWDWDITSFPKIKLNAWESNVGDFTSQVIAFMLTYNISLTGHTPFGAFTFEFGYGMANMNVQDSMGLDENQVRRTKRYNINYIGFLDERWFFTAAFNQYHLEENIGRAGHYELDKWYQTSFGFGFYFPDLKTIIREWFRY